MISIWRKAGFFALSLAFTIALGSQLAAQAQAPHYDLLLKGGHVIDPANDVDKIADVAISAGKIVAVAESIPEARRRKWSMYPACT